MGNRKTEIVKHGKSCRLCTHRDQPAREKAVKETSEEKEKVD